MKVVSVIHWNNLYKDSSKINIRVLYIDYNLLILDANIISAKPNKITSNPTDKTKIQLIRGENSYRVSECLNSFVSCLNKKETQENQKIPKPKVKKFVCNLCDKKFSAKNTLVEHTRMHTGERPFQCDQCVSRFITKSALTHHLRTHSGAKPFTCEICDLKFRQSCHLTCHLRTHTGERPYQCVLCERGFTQSSNLNRHLKRTHPFGALQTAKEKEF